MKILSRKISAIIGIFTLFTLLLYVFITTNPALPAQAADSTLRPLIGNQGTLDLESLYFFLNDQINKVEYSYQKPNANVFSSSLLTNPEQVAGASVSSTMNLANIKLSKYFSPLPMEGVWQPIANALFPHETILAKTFIQTDPARSYAIVSLIKMNMKKLNIGVRAGTYYPGGPSGKFGKGRIPRTIQQANSLVAAFNGGFMAKDGHYGMIVGNTSYVPLRKNLASLLIYKNGTAKFINYQGQPLPANVAAVRQNGAFLIHHGKITPFVETGTDTWGRTTTNSMYTWRSGIGITKNGNLIYAVGNSLIPSTLAAALKDAGAIDAIQLDINPYWVRYVLYTSLGKGRYTYVPLLRDMQNGGYAYLHGYNKDFFYIYKKPAQHN